MGNDEFKALRSSTEYCSKKYGADIFMISSFDPRYIGCVIAYNDWNMFEFYCKNKWIVVLKEEVEFEKIFLGKNFEVSNEQPEGLIFTISFESANEGSQRWKIRCRSQEEYAEWTRFIKKSLRIEWKKSNSCQICRKKFGFFGRKHHCRKCGSCVCDKCSPFRSTLPELDYSDMVRICENCGKNISAKRKGALSCNTPNFNRNNKYY